MNNFEKDIITRYHEKLAASADVLMQTLQDSVGGLEPYLNSGWGDLMRMDGSDAAKLMDALGPAEKNKLKKSFWLGIGDYGIGHNPRNVPTRMLNDTMYELAAQDYVNSHPFKIRHALTNRAMDVESKAIHYLDNLNKATGYSLPKDYKLGLFDKLKRMLGIGPKSLPDIQGFIEKNISENVLKNTDAKALTDKVLSGAPTVARTAMGNLGQKIHNLAEVLKKVK